MPSTEQTIQTYQALADLYEKQRDAAMRDRFLLLSADALHTAGRAEDAERLRARLLQGNPHHLLRPFLSFAEAMKSADVQAYMSGLRQTYPPEKAVQMLDTVRRSAPAANPPPAVPQSGVRSVGDLQLAPVEQRQTYGIRDDLGPRAVPNSLPNRSSMQSGYRLQPESPLWPKASRNGPPEPELAEVTPGAWVCDILFLVAIAAAVALAGYTLARPFLAF
jgi:hypothetical protein